MFETAAAADDVRKVNTDDDDDEDLETFSGSFLYFRGLLFLVSAFLT